MWFWNLLLDPLMRSGTIEVLDISIEHPVKLLLMQDKQVIETLSTYTAQKVLNRWWLLDRHRRVCRAAR